MTRVLVLNNYPFEKVWQEVRNGEKPDHHLYGINYFHERGYQVDIIPFQTASLTSRINMWVRGKRLLIPIGDLDQQYSVLRKLRKGDLIYSPCQTQTHLLSYLRAVGLLQAPIVCLAHHPLEEGRLAALRKPFFKMVMKGTDAFPSLSQGVADEVNSLACDVQKSWPLRWGPDSSFYPNSCDIGRGVVAVGRTGRDFQTFGIAASQTRTPAHIICLQSDVSDSFDDFGDNVQVTVQPNDNHMKYPDLLEVYANARALAIPLLPGISLSGLTSLMDALGIGKPVIMTKHPLIDLDIEAEGIGFWVEPGDVEGWKAAIHFFERNEDASIKMGNKAKRLVQEGMNSRFFASQVMDVFEKVL
jgi:glycosyltransferase involved in cell wall biosynthesis